MPQELTLNAEERKALIDALVANCSGWEEDDRPTLEAFTDNKLKGHAERCAEAIHNQQLIANARETGEISLDEIDDETLVAALEARGYGQEEEQTVINEQMDMDQWMAIAPPEVQSVVAEAINFQNAQKASLIEQIVANKRNRFSEDYLAERSVEELEALADIAQPVTRGARASYAGAAAPVTTNARRVEADDALPLPIMDFTSAG